MIHDSANEVPEFVDMHGSDTGEKSATPRSACHNGNQVAKHLRGTHVGG